MTSNRISNIIIGAIVIVVLALSYFYFYGGEEPTVTSGLVAETQLADSSEAEIEAFLKQVATVRYLVFSREVFESKVLAGLKDQSRELNEEKAGRTNPFAPLGEQSFFNSSFSETNFNQEPVAVPEVTPPAKNNTTKTLSD